jgi:dihydroflavonol-4-reductase
VLLSRMLCDIAALVGRRGPQFRLPWNSVLPIAYAAEATAWVTGREPLTTVDGVRLAKSRMFFNPAKAEQQLGVRARPYLDGLRDAIRWYCDAGYITQ